MIDLAVILATSNPQHQSNVTYNRAKVMLPILGKPMVIRVMEQLHKTQIRNYIIVIGEEEGAIGTYLQHQWLPNTNIQFMIQPHSSTITRTITEIYKHHQQPFLITTYNNFTHPNFPETFLKEYEQTHPELLLSGTTSPLSKSHPSLVAEVDNKKIKKLSQPKSNHNKNNLTIGNLAICGHQFNQFLAQKNTHIPPNKQLTDTFLTYVNSNQPTYITEASWLLQINNDYDLLTANQQLLNNHQDAHILSEIPTSVQITPPIRIDPNVSVGKGSKLGPYVYLESNSSVGQNTTLDNTIVLENTTIPAGSRYKNSILARHLHLHISSPDML